MRKKNILSAVVMIAMLATTFTGCKPSVPEGSYSETAATNADSEAVSSETTEITKAPVTLYANFDKEVLNDAPTTLPDDGFYYEAFTSIGVSEANLGFWASVLSPKSAFTSMSGVGFDCGITDTKTHVEYFKTLYLDKDDFSVSNDDFENIKQKTDVNMWYDFCSEYLCKGGCENAVVYPVDFKLKNDEYYEFEKLDTEVMPKIAELAEMWLDANFYGEVIPEEYTTEDFRQYVDTNAAYSYFASKGVLPYQIDNNDITKEALEASGVEDTRELFTTDRVSIWSNYGYTNFMMSCTSRLYLKTEDGQENTYPIKYKIVVKPEKADDGSWSFRLDYATFEQNINAMDKWGTISSPKACTELQKAAFGIAY